MEKRRLDKQNSGFSVIEMMAAVAILVILMGVGMVGVARYRDVLKLTELDNGAREIFLAAENRAVLLSSSQRLYGKVQDVMPGELARPAGAGGGAEVLALAEGAEAPADDCLYYVSKTQIRDSIDSAIAAPAPDGTGAAADPAATATLLTLGSIDPALMDGDFYIVYDLKAGSVTDVFYAEEDLTDLVGGNFEKFYEDWSKSTSDRLALKRSGASALLVGHYNGQAPQGENLAPEQLPSASVVVTIRNEEKLTVTVKYEAPAPAKLSVKLGNIDLTGRSDRIERSSGAPVVLDGKTTYSYECTWLLDSLEAGKQFKDLGCGVAPGGNFAVTATITPQTPGDFQTTSGKAVDNSLFQWESSRENEHSTTASIQYLRHLQNLDAVFSGVQGKTVAVQTANILCANNKTYPDYDFTPITNDTLTSYDGGRNTIRNLSVSGAKGGDAGLFSAAPGTLKDIRLVNASVKAGSGENAGALAGEAGTVTIDGCWVYWERDEVVTSLTDTLGTDVDEEDYYKYQISGQYAGGLVGRTSGTVTITNSLAATLVEGSMDVGGFVGHADGNVTASTSYADCYLKSTGSDYSVAGLVGWSNAHVGLTNCYAAGYILGGKNPGGLRLGTGSTKATNVYSVMRYPTRKDGGIPLTANVSGDSFTHTYYLGTGTDGRAQTYETMVGDGFITTMGGSFARKTLAQSHPYNLREHLRLSTYSYPGLKDLPHYGDWGAEFKDPSLVYYEKYTNTSSIKSAGDWAVSGGNARSLVRSLTDTGVTVQTDGYAVAFLKSQYKSGDVKVTYRYFGKEGNLVTTETLSYQPADMSQNPETGMIESWWTNEDGTRVECYIIPLPEEPKLVNSDYAEEDFYRYIEFTLEMTGQDGAATYRGEYLFNPHFAETVNPLEAKTGDIEWAQGEIRDAIRELVKGSSMEVLIRTPRHFYDLSRFEEYYHNGKRNYVFQQVLDLDYEDYSGYNGFIQAKAGTGGTVEPYRQTPVGTGFDKAFLGTYNGGCNEIRNVAPRVESGTQWMGLFGCSNGRLENIVYAPDPDYQVVISLGSSAQNLYAGALVGSNTGTLDNCAVYGVNLMAGASGVRLYIGGLAGQNSGTIRNCAAEFACLSTNCFNFATVYIGGLVGQNAKDRAISRSYAVGRIQTEVDSTVHSARICGFVGYNSGDISQCYTAVDLEPGNENVEVYGFCGEKEGSQSNTAFLDQNNFTYRDKSYAAKYARTGADMDKAASMVYSDLASKDEAGKLGMGTLWSDNPPANPAESFPYPAVIRDKNGEYTHYGKWPYPMALGEMGVFYWEKLVDSTGNATYHMSALAVDPAGGEDQKGTITKQSTLITDHDDGRYVTDYGYGYYTKGAPADIKLDLTNIGYAKYQTHSTERKDPFTPDQLNTTQTREERAQEIQKLSDNEKVAAQLSEQREIAAETALSDANGGYTFHCWNTFREAPRKADQKDEEYRRHRAVNGLSLYKTKITDEITPTTGRFTLTQQVGGVWKPLVEFYVNPQFADAMAVKSTDGAMSALSIEASIDAKGGSNVPGTTEENPYQIRCGLQLQDINWYDTAYTDVPVGYVGYTALRFPYLSGFTMDGEGKITAVYERDFYWKQTHDIDWVKERNSYNVEDNKTNDNGVFFPIAQSFVNADDPKLSYSKPLFMGWFSGTYDGDHYTLKNFAIAINTYTYQTNCMGLFGVTKGATLKNIVLFSESGDEVVEVKGRSNRSDHGQNASKLQDERDAWYAGGVLVGLAMKGDQGEGEITNCAVAGYTIRDVSSESRIQSGASDRKIQLDGRDYGTYVDMGGALGGLVGMTDLDLTGCTASVTIKLNSTYPGETTSESWYAPLRVGGLVGSTMGNVTDCYTGGTIDADEYVSFVNQKSKSEVYVGMITGGIGMVTKNYYTHNQTTNRLLIEDCYSTLTIKNTKEYRSIFQNANMNGLYGGYTKRENCYYLDGTWEKGKWEGEQSVTYRQLAGTEMIQGTDGTTKDIYAWLNDGKTNDDTKFYKVSNKISGLPAPGRFSFVPATEANKPLQGVDYPFPTVLTMDGYHVHYGAWGITGIKRADGGAPVQLDVYTGKTASEKLEASNLNGGIWSVSAGDAEALEVKIDQTGNLTYTAKAARAEPVIVTVTYTVSNTSYTMDITVYITAEVILRPGAIRLFPGDEVTLAMAPYGLKAKDQKEEDRPSLTAGTLTLKAAASNAAAVKAELVPDTTQVKLTRDAEDVAAGIGAQVSVEFEYAEGYTKADTHYIEVSRPDLTGAWNEDGTEWTVEFPFDGTYESSKVELWDGAKEQGFTAKMDGARVTLTGKNADLPEDAALTVTFTEKLDVAGVTHTVTVPVKRAAAPAQPEEDVQALAMSGEEAQLLAAEVEALSTELAAPGMETPSGEEGSQIPMEGEASIEAQAPEMEQETAEEPSEAPPEEPSAQAEEDSAETRSQSEAKAPAEIDPSTAENPAAETIINPPEAEEGLTAEQAPDHAEPETPTAAMLSEMQAARQAAPDPLEEAPPAENSYLLPEDVYSR